MKLATLVKNEDAIIAQYDDIGIPSEKELQDSSHTIWNENDGCWESNDGTIIYANEQNGGSSDNGGSECVGSYPVSGYTRADGTEVSSYVRTCGAAHAGTADNSPKDKKTSNSNSNPEENDWDSVNIDELDEYSETNLIEEYYKNKSPYTGYIAKSQLGEDLRNELREVSQAYRNYDRLTTDEKLQKFVTKNSGFPDYIPMQDYYKISLDLVDQPEKLKNNSRNHFYKLTNLPSNINKNDIYEKVASSLKLDTSKLENKKIIENTTVVIPQPDSPLVQMVKESKVTKELINKYYKILSQEKTEINTSTIYNDTSNIFETNLFGVLNKVDIRDMKLNKDGSLTFYISDFYDFDYIDTTGKKENYGHKIFSEINNKAYYQQKANKLKPYMIYIPVTISKEELKNIIKYTP